MSVRSLFLSLFPFPNDGKISKINPLDKSWVSQNHLSDSIFYFCSDSSFFSDPCFVLRGSNETVSKVSAFAWLVKWPLLFLFKLKNS